MISNLIFDLIHDQQQQNTPTPLFIRSFVRSFHDHNMK